MLDEREQRIKSGRQKPQIVADILDWRIDFMGDTGRQLPDTGEFWRLQHFALGLFEGADVADEEEELLQPASTAAVKTDIEAMETTETTDALRIFWPFIQIHLLWVNKGFTLDFGHYNNIKKLLRLETKSELFWNWASPDK